MRNQILKVIAYTWLVSIMLVVIMFAFRSDYPYSWLLLATLFVSILVLIFTNKPKAK